MPPAPLSRQKNPVCSVPPPAGLEWKVSGKPDTKDSSWVDRLDRVEPNTAPLAILFVPSRVHCTASLETLHKSGHKIADGSDRLPESLHAQLVDLGDKWGACLESGENDAFFALLPLNLSESDARLVRTVLALVADALPPSPRPVSIWAEFKRSGWSDARTALANTLDSKFKHLVIAPVAKFVFGGVVSFFAQFRSAKETSTTPVGRFRS